MAALATSAAAAAWEADAIEPVVSPRSSFFASFVSSTSTDGESSQCSSGLGRFRGLRVSIQRRRKSRPLHLHVPLLPRASDGSARRSLPQYRSYRRRVSMASSSSSADHATCGGSQQCHWQVVQDMASTTTTQRTDASNSPESCDLERPSECTQSRRRRAWSMLKGHVRLPRLKSEKKAAAMFSISFYPWKMEARGYYSNPEAAAEWVPDTASTRCQICLAAFNLARRRHHCRLCGHLVCNDCSLQRTFLPFSEDAHRRSNHSMIKSGEAQRTCNSCTKTLKSMVAQHDHRVKEFNVDVSVITHSADEGAYRASVSGRSSKAGRLSQSSVGRTSSELQLQLVRPRAVSNKTGAIRNEELDQVLKARAKSRATGSITQQHIISSEWLEQWLQFVQLDSGDSGHPHYARPSISSRSSLGSRRRSSRLKYGHRPGPIANYALLDFVNGKLVPREGLLRSRGTEGTGDYRVISHEVWLVFLRLYGGGPCIVIDENCSRDDASHASHSLVVPGSIVPETIADSPSSHHWIITEIDDVVSAKQFSTAYKVSPEKCLMKENLSNTDQSQLAVRSQPTCDDFKSKTSSKRPASATTIGGAYHTSALTRSTSESTRNYHMNDQENRRSTSIVSGYLKKWRHGVDSSRASVSSTTISQVDGEGVVLYDPVKQETIPKREDADEDPRGFSSSEGPSHQRDTIAAVSAFAVAAAEARRKSTMSLMRHSTTVTTRTSQSSVMSA